MYRVRKCLFGFKQSNRLWDDLFAEHLTTKMGFVQSIADPCVYTLHKDGHTIIMATWTDDLIIASSSKAFRDKFITTLAQKFDLRDQGAATDILGAELTRAQDGSLKLSMGKYVKQLLKKAGMSDCNAVSTPAETGLRMERATSDDSACDVHFGTMNFRATVGCLIWLATVCQTCHTPACCADLSKPTPKCGPALKRVLQYLRGLSILVSCLVQQTQLSQPGPMQTGGSVPTQADPQLGTS